MKTSSLHQDPALILAWPDATIRGDEAWMMFFKKIGLVKNLNFKVGHTGIILIERATGELHFYDFGRYIAPPGTWQSTLKEVRSSTQYPDQSKDRRISDYQYRGNYALSRKHERCYAGFW